MLTATLLAFDGAALLGVSAWKGRLLFALLGLVFLFSAAVVLLPHDGTSAGCWISRLPNALSVKNRTRCSA
jgi:hypothetical protein